MSKHKRILIGDWETTGIPNSYNTDPYISGPQGIQFGGVVVEDIFNEWAIVDQIEFTLKWLGPDVDTERPELPDLDWNDKAEEIHGMSRKFLRNMPHPESLHDHFKQFVNRNFPNSPILFGGHNPTFDMYFNHQFLLFSELHDEIRYSHRMLDSFSVGFMTFGIDNSDDLFERVGCKKRSKHNALEDTINTVKVFREISKINPVVFEI